MQKSLGLHLKGAAAALGAVKALAAPMQAVKKQHCSMQTNAALAPQNRGDSSFHGRCSSRLSSRAVTACEEWSV